MQQFIQTRAFYLSVLILSIFALVCSRIPLFNYLGFEFSALTVLLAGFVCGILMLSFWKHQDCRRRADVWKFIGESLAAQLVLLLIPFLLSLANGFFVKNCSIGDGTVMYALIVLPGVFFSVALAMVVGVVFDQWRKTIFTGFYLLVLVHIPLITFFRPQIFAFNPIPGFFPGLTYDETLHVIQRLSAYRISTFAAIGSLLAGSVWIWQVRSRKKEHAQSAQHSFPFLEIALLAFFIPFILMTLLFSDRLGFSSSRHYIQQKLAGNYKTAHFEIIYPAGSVKHDRIEQLGHLHEFYYEKLSCILNILPQEHIVSFLYSSSEEKGKLIGANRTDIAKPWLRQIHINLADVETGLKHEMAHILASEFGWSPFKISRNSGLVEGIAVAVGDDVWYDEPLDRAAALVLSAGVDPDMESLFSFAGFAKVHAGVSYTLAGSFCRFLIDSFGIDQFKKVYESGDFLRTYGTALPSLLSAWRINIQSQHLSSCDSMKARYLFRRPSIFGKECVRVIANVNAATRDLLARHESQKALALAEQSLALSKTPEAVIQKTTAIMDLKKFKDAVDFIEHQLKDTSFSFALLPLHLKLGDAYWALDSLQRARQEYALMASVHLSAWYDEACALRLESLKNERERSELLLYYTFANEDTVRLGRLSKLSSPLSRYLLACELAGKGNFAEARSLFEHIDFMTAQQLEFFRLFRLGRVYFSLREWEKAASVYEKAGTVAPTSALAIELREWKERCQFELK
jgi:tetratricopeptide (TPR) repeat protein